MPLDLAVPYADLTFRIIGAAMRVHNRLGPGLRELHYHRALTAELIADGLSVSEEHAIDVFDGEAWLGRMFLDQWVEDKVVVEIKAFPHMLTDEEMAQIIGYMIASSSKVGILINFGRKRLQYKRILPPRKTDDWKHKVERFLWKPRTGQDGM